MPTPSLSGLTTLHCQLIPAGCLSICLILPYFCGVLTTFATTRCRETLFVAFKASRDIMVSILGELIWFFVIVWWAHLYFSSGERRNQGEIRSSDFSSMLSQFSGLKLITWFFCLVSLQWSCWRRPFGTLNDNSGIYCFMEIFQFSQVCFPLSKFINDLFANILNKLFKLSHHL